MAQKSATSDSSFKRSSGIHPWHTLTVQDICVQLGVTASLGLSEEEARNRLAQFGPNRLYEEKREPVWKVFLEEIYEPMILLLLATGILYALWGEWIDTLTIFTVILAVVGVEIFNEYRAEKSLAALRKLAEPTTLVRRDGQYREVSIEEIVPGDVIVLQAGRRTPADARLLEAYGLAVDESSLTGESVPVEKEASLVLPEDTPLAERRNLVFTGTTILRGRGTAVIVATGMTSELGRVAALIREVKEPRTPLQQTMHGLTRWMVWLALGFSTVVPLLGWLLGNQSPRQMLLTGLSLAFATIPEELPILITIMLALGAYHLSQRQAIVKRLRAAETLSAVTVIATDKTGTLTENHMKVNEWYPESLGRQLLKLGVLCNNAVENNGKFMGDPLEIALFQAARKAGLDVDVLRQAYPLRQEFTFDNLRKMMSTVYARYGNLWIIVKGAPESVLAHSTHHWQGEDRQPFMESDRQAVLTITAQLAHKGLRVIAFAEKTVPEGPLSQNEAESNLTFVGLIGLADPPRPEVKDAMAVCRVAGIRLIMITGDHPLTARAIATQVGMAEGEPLLTGSELDTLSDEALREVVHRVTIYAHTTPEHKLRIVQALQERGEVVAVTGDGINDAPALAAAEIGIAMGETGSDVAREAADMVLANDNFATLVYAIQEGRLLFANLKKAIRYYLACKVALVSVTLLPVLLRIPIPFSPIQVILMELFMDLGASATFVTEQAESDLMHHPPRNPTAPFMDRTLVRSIFSSAAGLFAAVSAAYLIPWLNGAEPARAQTMAFMTWLLGHIFLALNLRSEREPLSQLGLFSNPLMTAWGLATIIFILIVTQVPPLQEAFKTVTLKGQEWILTGIMAILGTFWIEISKRQKARSKRQ